MTVEYSDVIGILKERLAARLEQLEPLQRECQQLRAAINALEPSLSGRIQRETITAAATRVLSENQPLRCSDIQREMDGVASQARCAALHMQMRRAPSRFRQLDDKRWVLAQPEYTQ